MIVTNCYRVCRRPPPSNIGSAYYQQSRIMESEDESSGMPIDPYHQTIRYLQIFIQGYQQQGYCIFLLVDAAVYSYSWMVIKMTLMFFSPKKSATVFTPHWDSTMTKILMVPLPLLSNPAT
jgi:hypothetical protein